MLEIEYPRVIFSNIARIEWIPLPKHICAINCNVQHTLSLALFCTPNHEKKTIGLHMWKTKRDNRLTKFTNWHGNDEKGWKELRHSDGPSRSILSSPEFHYCDFCQPRVSQLNFLKFFVLLIVTYEGIISKLQLHCPHSAVARHDIAKISHRDDNLPFISASTKFTFLSVAMNMQNCFWPNFGICNCFQLSGYPLVVVTITSSA